MHHIQTCKEHVSKRTSVPKYSGYSYAWKNSHFLTVAVFDKRFCNANLYYWVFTPP
jgi:hypothetical protein